MFSGLYVAKVFLFMYVHASKQIYRGKFTKANFGLKKWISLSCPVVRKKRERKTGSFRVRLIKAPSRKTYFSSLTQQNQVL